MNAGRQRRLAARRKGSEGTASTRASDPEPAVIVVPLDGSAEAKAALPAARLVAPTVGGTLHVVQAVDHVVTEQELLRRLNLTTAEARDLVVDQIVGSAAEAIVRFSTERQAALIVMTTRGQTAYLGRTVRPVVEQVIRDAPCPALLVRPEIAERVASMTGLHRILLPLDGAPSSAAVIGPALRLAEASGAEVDILYVAALARRPSEPGTLTAPLYVDQPQYEWPAWAREFTRRFGTALGACPLPVHTRLSLRCGEPGHAILLFAREHHSDLIVLEWRGSLDPHRAAVARRVLTDAPCPVLLIHTHTHTALETL